MTVQCCRKDDGCKGSLDEKRAFGLRTGCHSSTRVYPCNECGRVSTIETEASVKVAIGMHRRSGEEVYLNLEKDELFYKVPRCSTCKTEMKMDEETYEYKCPSCIT